MNKKSSAFRQKRSATKMSTIEKNYGKDFSVRSDMKLGTYLRKVGYPSLSRLLQDAK
jgi:hypothetical protein